MEIQDSIMEMTGSEIEEYTYEYLPGRMAVWVGRVHVQPIEGCEYFDRNVVDAYTNLVTLAFDEEHFKNHVTEILTPLKLRIVEFTDVSRMADRIKAGAASQELQDLIDDAQYDGGLYQDFWEVMKSEE